MHSGGSQSFFHSVAYKLLSVRDRVEDVWYIEQPLKGAFQTHGSRPRVGGLRKKLFGAQHGAVTDFQSVLTCQGQDFDLALAISSYFWPRAPVQPRN